VIRRTLSGTARRGAQLPLFIGTSASLTPRLRAVNLRQPQGYGRVEILQVGTSRRWDLLRSLRATLSVALPEYQTAGRRSRTVYSQHTPCIGRPGEQSTWCKHQPNCPQYTTETTYLLLTPRGHCYGSLRPRRGFSPPDGGSPHRVTLTRWYHVSRTSK